MTTYIKVFILRQFYFLFYLFLFKIAGGTQAIIGAKPGSEVDVH